MTNPDLRFFLAHDKDTPDSTINEWVETLTTALDDAYPNTEVTVVSGRDDFASRFKAAGGWKGWPRSVVDGTLWDGAPRFNGIIRPARLVEGTRPSCGRATFDMLTGFLVGGKTAWLWDYEEDRLATIEQCRKLDGDSWKQYGEIFWSAAEQ